MNDWLDEFRDRPNVTLVRYEDLKNDPPTHFVNVLAAVGEAEISQPSFEAALQFSQFGNMKRMETAGAFDSKILQTRDQRDAEAFDVRRGKIGGYSDYLSPDDHAYAGKMLAALNPEFGYS